MKSEQVYRIVPDRSCIQFSFRSTLHAVSGSGSQLGGELFIGEDNLVTKGFIRIPVGQFQTGHDVRDENMLSMFKSQEYPFIKYSINQSSRLDRQGLIRLQGNLQIRDVIQPLELIVGMIQHEQGFGLTGSFEIGLRDFRLRPPSVLFVIRVFNKIKINFDAFVRSEHHVSL